MPSALSKTFLKLDFHNQSFLKLFIDFRTFLKIIFFNPKISFFFSRLHFGLKTFFKITKKKKKKHLTLQKL